MCSLHFILITVCILGYSACSSDNIPEYDYEDVDSLDDPPEEVEEPKERQSRFVGSFENQFVGTNLLGPRGLHRKCFTPEDEELLSARMAFEVKLIWEIIFNLL